LGDDRDRDRDRMRAKAGDDRERVLRQLGDRVRETGELTPSWGIEIAERYYMQRADLLPEPLDPGSEDTVLEQLRLGPSWNYADPEEVAAERERVLGALRALAKEGKVQSSSPTIRDRPPRTASRLSTCARSDRVAPSSALVPPTRPTE
jgi:hypothetical protein